MSRGKRRQDFLQTFFRFSYCSSAVDRYSHLGLNQFYGQLSTFPEIVFLKLSILALFTVYQRFMFFGVFP